MEQSGSFMAFLDKSQNEIHLYENKGNSSQRLKIYARVQQKDEKNKVNCIAFDPTGILWAGLTNGQLQQIDVKQGKILLTSECLQNTPIKQLIFLKKQKNLCMVLAANKYILYEPKKREIQKSFISKKKQTQIPQMVCLSSDDKFALETHNQTIHLRDLVQNQVIAKFEGHSSTIQSISFVENQDSPTHFVSAAGSECLFWEIASNKNKQQGIEEVVQPAKILDVPSSTQLIQSISSYQVMQGAYITTCCSSNALHLYMTKISQKSKSSKVKKVDSVMQVKEKMHSILQHKIMDMSTVSVTYGNAFQVVKEEISFVEEDGTTLKKEVDLEWATEKQIVSKQKKGGEEYQVTGIEDHQQLQTGTSLFNLSEIKGVDSRKTSSSTHIQGGSLQVVLKQALTSEDRDQIDWILSNKDEQLIEKTLSQLTEQKHVQKLFKQIVQKYQQQNPTEMVSVTLWLKMLLSIHWQTIITHMDSNETSASLQSLKMFINQKTKHLNDVLVVSGKLEMLKQCTVQSSPTDKYKKIKSNLKKQKKDDEEEQILVYKDQSDDEGDLDKIMDAEDLEDDYDDEEGEESFDEEIEAVDIIQKKQRKVDDYDSEAEDDDMMLDDSVSSDEDKKKKKKKKSKKQRDADSDEEDDQFQDDYGSESADEVDEDERTMRQRLVDDSDEEQELQADQEQDSDQMSDI